MPTPEAAHHRVLIVQDVPASAQQQEAILREEAARRHLATFTCIEDLRVPPNTIIRKHLEPLCWDWLVLDLLISPIDDHDPLNSAGVNLMRRIHDRGLFHAYRGASDLDAHTGVRCVAVYSATIGGTGKLRDAVRATLSDCGVRDASLYRPGEMRRLAHDLCEEMAKP